MGKKDKMRKESTEKEMEHEKVIRNDMICQKWIDQGRRCLRYQDNTCRYEHPPMCQQTCRDPNCKRLHYGKATEELSRENERRKAEIRELRKKEKCRNMTDTGFCKFGSVCRYQHPNELKTEEGKKEDKEKVQRKETEKREETTKKEDKQDNQKEDRGTKIQDKTEQEREQRKKKRDEEYIVIDETDDDY